MGVLRAEVSEAARLDLVLQSEWYLLHADENIADRYLEAFDLSLRKLQSAPEIGRLRKFRDRRLQGLRSIKLNGAFRVHLIFYRTEGEALVVFRVMHGMRDLPRRLVQAPTEQD